jgi:hypothetical protein
MKGTGTKAHGILSGVGVWIRQYRLAREKERRGKAKKEAEYHGQSISIYM